MMNELDKSKNLKPSYKNLGFKSYDLSISLTKKQIKDLGFKGRFWSTRQTISLKNLIANVLCQPQSYREIFRLAGIVGIITLKDFAERLYNSKEMDKQSYQYFSENILILEEYQALKQGQSSSENSI